MEKLIGNINYLKTQLDSLSPMSEQDESRLWQKFRLLWNYNSNHIEGNTLTYGQTVLLFKLGNEFRPENSPLKDVLEMKAHDVAVHLIKSYAVDSNFKLSEKFIRELNETILVEAYHKEAKTSDGQKTFKKIIPGQYKELPNHVLLPNGDIFRYTEPGDVTAEMQSLMEWYRSDDGLPIIKAAALHYKFITIHPFDDGNGRTARLLMNYHLMREGYPPIIITSEDKANYYYALRQADSGDIDAFIKYIAEQLVTSLTLAIKAAKGEEIEEPEDIDRRLSILKKQINSISKDAPLRESSRVKEILAQEVFPIFEKYVESLKRFEDVVTQSLVFVTANIPFDDRLDDIGRWQFFIDSIDSEISPSEVSQFFKLNGIAKTALPFNLEFVVTVLLRNDEYLFENTLTKKAISVKYNRSILQNEIDSDIKETERLILQKIEAALK